MSSTSLLDIVALAKRRGFAYPGSEIYGGLANTWDYGPLGVELKRNIESLWWKSFVSEKENMIGIDSSIILNTKVWEASGHLSGFQDALVDCRNCKSRTRADHLIEDFFARASPSKEIRAEGLSKEELSSIIAKNQIPCPVCGKSDLTEVRLFNLLFPTKMGILSDDSDAVYLRGETAQGIFINFKNILDSTRLKLPFGVAQIGKSFRNEITKGQFVHRMVEFTQGEIEYFFDPTKENWETLFQDWLSQIESFLINKLGLRKGNIRTREHDEAERSFYSQKTVDLEYNFPYGFKELWGLAYRTDYDLASHAKHSGKDLFYTDPHTGEKIVPHVIEPAVGFDRLVLACLVDAYWYDENNQRIVLKLSPSVAPTTVAVFPLLRNNSSLVLKARKVYEHVSKVYRAAWDDRGNIGKRYLYQDEAGTPLCVTVDHESLENETVTVRDRDTTKQDRVELANLLGYIEAKLTKN